MNDSQLGVAYGYAISNQCQTWARSTASAVLAWRKRRSSVSSSENAIYPVFVNQLTWDDVFGTWLKNHVAVSPLLADWLMERTMSDWCLVRWSEPSFFLDGSFSWWVFELSYRPAQTVVVYYNHCGRQLDEDDVHAIPIQLPMVGPFVALASSFVHSPFLHNSSQWSSSVPVRLPSFVDDRSLDVATRCALPKHDTNKWIRARLL